MVFRGQPTSGVFNASGSGLPLKAEARSLWEDKDLSSSDDLVFKTNKGVYLG